MNVKQRIGVGMPVGELDWPKVNMTVNDPWVHYIDIGVAPPKSVSARIRVEFNRDLTYSEREDFRLAFQDDFEDEVVVEFSDPKHVWITDYDDIDSRELFRVVAEYVEFNYVNVHPKAVYTEIPRIRV